MDIDLFPWGSKKMHFTRCITFHPDNSVQLRLCQHSQGSQIWAQFACCILDLAIVVSPDIFNLF